MKPWLVGVTLSLAPIQKLGYDPKNGPETVLAEAPRRRTSRSRGGNRRTADRLLQRPVAKGADRVPDLDHRRPAQGGRGNGRDGRRMGQGDPDALAKTMNESLKDSPEVAKTLLTDRNARWATWIKQRMASPAPSSSRSARATWRAMTASRPAGQAGHQGAAYRLLIPIPRHRRSIRRSPIYDTAILQNGV